MIVANIVKNTLHNLKQFFLTSSSHPTARHNCSISGMEVGTKLLI